MAEALVEFFAGAPQPGTSSTGSGQSLNVEDMEQAAEPTPPVAGKTVVFTGTLETDDPPGGQGQGRALGAKVAGSVSAKTDIVVAGAGAGSQAQEGRASSA